MMLCTGNECSSYRGITQWSRTRSYARIEVITISQRDTIKTSLLSSAEKKRNKSGTYDAVNKP